MYRAFFFNSFSFSFFFAIIFGKKDSILHLVSTVSPGHNDAQNIP